MKCKELAEEYGVTAMRIGRIRRKLDSHARGDLTPKHVQEIRNVLERQNRTDVDVTSQKPEIVHVVVTHPSNLSRYVECMERGKPGRFRLLLPFGTNKDAFPNGRVVKAIKVKEHGIKIYIHPSLAKGSWEYAE